jgi:choline dehydrogenase
MHANYLATDEDRRCALAGVRLARRIAATSPMCAYVKSEYRPGDAASSDDDLLEFCRQWGATIFHPVGTCKMGDDPAAVVDAKLRVHGATGLRVVDASIMPTICSGNTAAPVVMIAEKASDLILADA